MAYEQPMVTVDQNLTVQPTSIERQHPAFVFGPNYRLQRYTNDSEKELSFADDYAGGAQTLDYPNVISADNVDTDYTKLYGDNVVIRLDQLATPSLIDSPANVGVNGGHVSLFFKNQAYLDHDSDGNGVTRVTVKRDIVVGDEVVIEYKLSGEGESVSKTVLKAKVKSVVYRTNVTGIEEEAVTGTFMEIDEPIPESVAVASITVTLAMTADGVEFSQKSGMTAGEYCWKQVGGKIVIQTGGLEALVADYGQALAYKNVLSAELYVHYRELLTSYSDTIHSVVGSAAVADVLQTVDPDNPLAQGVYMAALNAATDDGNSAQPVYFMATPTADKDGYDAVLQRLTLTDRVYALAPTTTDPDVIDSVAEHCRSMSSKMNKLWRISFVAKTAPETRAVLNSLMDAEGDDFVAIPVTKTGATTPGQTGGVYTYLRVVKSASDITGNPDAKLNQLNRLVPGDEILFGYHDDNFGGTVPEKYTVKRVVNSFTVELTEAIVTTYLEASGETSYKPARVEAYHVFSNAEKAEEIAKVSRSLASRRVYNVFPPVFEYNGVQMGGEFAACAVAGLVSATEPQQPITNVVVRGISNIPLANVTGTFSRDELNVIAAGGTFIVTQDLPNDIVYVRHQISTAYYEGNINTAELSVTKNVDDISYRFADVFRPYNGKYNIVPGLIEILKNLAGQLISQIGKDNSTYGPQLILEDTEILYVRQNELMKDHVDVAIRLGVPYPCNNIDIVLTV